ncbi:hypothetical protein PLO_0021 [Pediococcus acidilactici NGRI 0510Q]|nr:hypothetical protein PLO_0021 [Pediococcus acidilactici NGRI 0510Q]
MNTRFSVERIYMNTYRIEKIRKRAEFYRKNIGIFGVKTALK